MGLIKVDYGSVGGGTTINPQIVWSPTGGSGVAYNACTNIPVTKGKTYCFTYFRNTTSLIDATLTGGDVITNLIGVNQFDSYVIHQTYFKATADTVSFAWNDAGYQIGAPILVQLD